MGGTKMASKCDDRLIEQVQQSKQEDGSIYANSPDTCTLLGLVKRQSMFSPVQELKDRTDFNTRGPFLQYKWWLKLRGLLRIFAHHTDVYEFTHSKLVHIQDLEKEDHD